MNKNIFAVFLVRVELNDLIEHINNQFYLCYLGIQEDMKPHQCRQITRIEYEDIFNLMFILITIVE